MLFSLISQLQIKTKVRPQNTFNTSSQLSPAIKQQGFSLIEIIVGIVVLTLSFSIITTLILPTEQQSADQLHQIKAAELAQSLLNEIQGKAFDENSDRTGGLIRCGENGTTCTSEENFGPEEGANNRRLFDDVDDYHEYTEILNSSEGAFHSGYNSFSLSISVTYDGLTLGLSENGLAKKVTITATTPLGSDITFSSYRANY